MSLPSDSLQPQQAHALCGSLVAADRVPLPLCCRYCVCDTEDGIALRGLFIIDKEGVVQHATINNLAFGRSVDETLRTLQVRSREGAVHIRQPGKLRVDSLS